MDEKTKITWSVVLLWVSTAGLLTAGIWFYVKLSTDDICTSVPPCYFVLTEDEKVVKYNFEIPIHNFTLESGRSYCEVLEEWCVTTAPQRFSSLNCTWSNGTKEFPAPHCQCITS